MVIFELLMKNELATSPISLAKMFQWSYDGPVGGVEISYANEGKEASNTIYLLLKRSSVDVMELISTTHDGMISLKRLKRGSDTSNPGSRTPASMTGNALPLPNPLKVMITYLEKPQTHDADQGSGWGPIADGGHTLGILNLEEPVLGIRMRHIDNQVMGLAWSRCCIEACISPQTCL